LVSVLAVGVAEFLAGPVVLLVFGAGYSDAVFLLRLLLPSFTLLCLDWVFISISIALGLARRQLRVSVTGMALNLAANMVLIPIWGARACCVTTLATEAVVIALSWRFVRAKVRPLWPTRGFLLRLSGLVPLALLAAISLMPIIAAVVFLVVYVAGAVLLRLVTVEDYRLALYEANPTPVPQPDARP
jgi:O-antigen/teichoic acid export membrane protein